MATHCGRLFEHATRTASLAGPADRALRPGCIECSGRLERLRLRCGLPHSERFNGTTAFGIPGSSQPWKSLLTFN